MAVQMDEWLFGHGMELCASESWTRGRDGQIRTADLPLRRRTLYPAELRPHVSLTLQPQAVFVSRAPALQALAPDVRAGSASRRSGSCRTAVYAFVDRLAAASRPSA